ncbi:MAG: hypothetical protein KJO81_07735, partial [Gammaproteobacteria bacterium]|nr:hypothetical protein [Gammaproteobacteria bacterium]
MRPDRANRSAPIQPQSAALGGKINMLASRAKEIPNQRAIRFIIENDSSPVSYAEAIHQWQNDADFREFFISTLINSPFLAYRWETPPVTIATADQPFEFVLLDSPDIAVDSDPTPFFEHFVDKEPEEIVEFRSLGGDSILVAPCPDIALTDYGHLAAYLRNS